jgi:hypothetical protein
MDTNVLDNTLTDEGRLDMLRVLMLDGVDGEVDDADTLQ